MVNGQERPDFARRLAKTPLAYKRGLKRFKRNALESTKTLEIAIAAADSIGDNCTPQTG